MKLRQKAFVASLVEQDDLDFDSHLNSNPTSNLSLAVEFLSTSIVDNCAAVRIRINWYLSRESFMHNANYCEKSTPCLSGSLHVNKCHWLKWPIVDLYLTNWLHLTKEKLRCLYFLIRMLAQKVVKFITDRRQTVHYATRKAFCLIGLSQPCRSHTVITSFMRQFLTCSTWDLGSFFNNQTITQLLLRWTCQYILCEVCSL